MWFQNLTAATGWEHDTNLSNQNPATNTGGRNITGIGTPLFPAFNLRDTTDSITAFFSPASWIGTPPTGFVSLDGPLPFSRRYRGAIGW